MCKHIFGIYYNLKKIVLFGIIANPFALTIGGSHSLEEYQMVSYRRLVHFYLPCMFRLDAKYTLCDGRSDLLPPLRISTR